MRRKVWMINRKMVLHHNILADQGKTTFRMGMNEFSDMVGQINRLAIMMSTHVFTVNYLSILIATLFSLVNFNCHPVFSFHRVMQSIIKLFTDIWIFQRSLKNQLSNLQ